MKITESKLKQMIKEGITDFLNAEKETEAEKQTTMNAKVNKIFETIKAVQDKKEYGIFEFELLKNERFMLNLINCKNLEDIRNSFLNNNIDDLSLYISFKPDSPLEKYFRKTREEYKFKLHGFSAIKVDLGNEPELNKLNEFFK